MLEDVVSGLRAFGYLFERRDARARPPLSQPDPVPEQVRQRWREVLAGTERLADADALSMLADYGIPVARTIGTSDIDGVLGAAGRLGYPVALKTAAAAHKTDVGGVVLGLEDGDSLAAAYREMAGRLGPAVTLQEMAESGVEMALGVIRDPQFGPLVMVAAGGVLIESLRDRRLALPPIDEPRARSIIDRLQSRPLLDGVRGAPAADVTALAHALTRLSLLARDLGDLITALDINPIIVHPHGCVAVDALVSTLRA